jgi:ribosomal protein S18 acetylase RimI-like enzyme
LPLPPVDHELVRRLEETAAAFGVARLEALRDRPETGLELRLERFGEAIAPVSPAQRELDFVNRIERLGPADAGQVDEILAFYASHGVDPWLELAPQRDVEALGAALGRAGPRIVGVHAVLYGRPEGGPARDIAVGRAEGAEVEAAARLLLEGYGVPESAVPTHGQALAAAVQAAGGSLYVARDDGAPAAAAVLTIADGVGYLASAATLPAYRSRGCQTALIAARVAAAAAAGCDLITSGAEFGSPSQRNLERAGLRVAYTKPVLRLTARAERTPAATA